MAQREGSFTRRVRCLTVYRYQLPTPRRRSKGQKARAKKRHRKLAGEEGRGDNTDGNDNDQMEILEDGNVQLGPAV